MEIDEALSFIRTTLITFDHQRKYNPIAYESMEEMDLSITVEV